MSAVLSSNDIAQLTDLVHRLSRGETVSVHLMRIAMYRAPTKSSALRWSQSGGLVRVFDDRNEKA